MFVLIQIVIGPSNVTSVRAGILSERKWNSI